MKFLFVDKDGPEYEKERMLRWEALSKTLGLPPGSEVFPEEENCMHLIAKEKDRVIGCVCFVARSAEEGEIFQMAVSEEYRGQGFGRKLIHFLEKTLMEKGVKRILVYAWQDSEGFYAKLGYAPQAEPVKKNGVLCHLMVKKL